MTLRSLVVTAALCATGTVLSAAPAQQAVPTTDPRIAHLEYWAESVLEHEPGGSDDRIVTVGSWSNRDLSNLGIDAGALVQVMRQPSRLMFTSRLDDGRLQSIRYAPSQIRRLREIACALAGVFSQPECKALKLAIDLDPLLARLSEMARLSRERGDENFLLRRGALLHTDIAMLGLAVSSEPLSQTTPVASQSIRVTISDGRETDLVQSASHWEIARMLLDEVKPPGSSKPAPGRDDMVRLWYRATATWMQRDDHHDTKHLDHAREMFPADADLQFLTGSEHETYAAPQIQTAIRSAVLPTGIRIAVDPERAELRAAERYLRRTVELEPEFCEAHLRLGRVLGLTGRPAEAADHLRKALALLTTPSDDADLLEYYASLFLGDVEEALAHAEVARASYERAAALFPLAQSPRLALSALERRAGNRDGALREIQRVFDLPAQGRTESDPWWTYHTAQGRQADALIEELRRPFLPEGER